MKKLIALALFLSTICSLTIAQDVSKRSNAQNGWVSIAEIRTQNYKRAQLKHNGTDYSKKSKRRAMRKAERTQRKLYKQSERNKKE